MYAWIVEHEQVLGLAAEMLMAVIWIAYLQLFVLGYIHQRRPMIIIERGAGKGDEARCFVSNMGAEPIYLISVIADLTIDGTVHRTFLTDRDDIAASDLSCPSEATNQGPLGTAEFVDLGSFGQLLGNALKHLGQQEAGDRVSCLTLTALCGSGHSMLLVAGKRDFRVGTPEDRRLFVATDPATEQITSRRRRRRLRAVLAKSLQDEAAALER